jgi:hypothetical protein
MSTRFRLGREEVQHGSELGNHDIGVAAALDTAIKDVATACVGAMVTWMSDRICVLLSIAYTIVDSQMR